MTTPDGSRPRGAPLSDPLLIHDKFLTGKVAEGSEAAAIVGQQLVLLGTQLVTQLNVLLKVARTHGPANSALDRPVASILTLVRTLGNDRPVTLRLQEGFVFLGDRHLTCIGIIPIGSLALLDKGELSVVLRPAPEREHAERPTVRIIADPSGAKLEPPLEVSLRQTDLQGRYERSIVRLIDDTEYRLDTSRYVIS